MPAKQHDFTATEIKAGIMVLASLIILVGFLVAIRGCRPQDETAKTFYAVFTDISGLNRGADVRFGGVQVGKVTAIEPDPDDRTHIRVTAVIEGYVPVNHGSIATIEQVTMTTEKHLEISTGGAETSTRWASIPRPRRAAPIRRVTTSIHLTDGFDGSAVRSRATCSPT